MHRESLLYLRSYYPKYLWFDSTRSMLIQFRMVSLTTLCTTAPTIMWNFTAITSFYYIWSKMQEILFGNTYPHPMCNLRCRAWFFLLVQLVPLHGLLVLRYKCYRFMDECEWHSKLVLLSLIYSNLNTILNLDTLLSSSGCYRRLPDIAYL